MRRTYAVYIHIPFCEKRCSYCDFVTYAGMKDWIPGYVDALCKEIQLAVLPDGQKRTIQSIFLGGGTPSILPPEFISQIFQALKESFEWTDSCEITIECNPGTLEPQKLALYKQIGINRLSIGMQSADETDLRLLGRIHNGFDVKQAISNARQAGFDNVNLDLIYGLPGQSIKSWERTLTNALEYRPEHLSCYALTIEPGTVLAEQIEAGLVLMPDDDVAADMLELACEILENAGYEHYEISNWAKKDGEGRNLSSKHNLQYWHNDWYYGFGVGAHGYLGEIRMANTNSIEDYVKALSNTDPLMSTRVSSQSLTIDDQMQEELMLRLRLLEEGVRESEFKSRYDQSVFDRFGPQIDDLVDQGLIEVLGKRPARTIRLTHRGLFLGNRVFGQFIGDGQ